MVKSLERESYVSYGSEVQPVTLPDSDTPRDDLWSSNDDLPLYSVCTVTISPST